MPKFRIYKSRYVQQVGEDYPRYVYADPDAPAEIELPDVDPATGEKYKFDRGLHSLDAPVVELKPHFAKPVFSHEPVKTAAEIQSKPSPKGSGRPSDKGI